MKQIKPFQSGGRSFLEVSADQSCCSEQDKTFHCHLSPRDARRDVSPPSQGRRSNGGPGWRQSPVRRGVVLGCVMCFCCCIAVIHGRARGGHCDWMRQAGIVAAGPSQELWAQTVVYPPSLGHWSQGRIIHRPQAGVLTLQTERQKTCYSTLGILKVQLLLSLTIESVTHIKRRNTHILWVGTRGGIVGNGHHAGVCWHL